MTGFITAQCHIRTAVGKSKTVRRRVGQRYGKYPYRTTPVGSQRQNIFGIRSDDNLAERHRIRRGGKRNFVFDNIAEFNSASGCFLPFGNIQSIVIIGKIRCLVLHRRIITQQQQRQTEYKNQQRSNTNRKNNTVGFLQISFGMCQRLFIHCVLTTLQNTPLRPNCPQTESPSSNVPIGPTRRWNNSFPCPSAGASTEKNGL